VVQGQLDGTHGSDDGGCTSNMLQRPSLTMRLLASTHTTRRVVTPALNAAAVMMITGRGSRHAWMEVL
jgi:hypothetical protein